MMDETTNKKERFATAKMIIKLIAGGLVELFVGAVTNHVIDSVRGPKAAKLGAKAGGFIVGMMVGDHVADYICDEIDKTADEFDELKCTIDKLKESIEEEEA